MTKRPSAAGNLGLHGRGQQLDQFRVMRIGSCIGGVGAGRQEYPRRADGIPARHRGGRIGGDLRVDIRDPDGDGIIGVAEDLERAEFLREIAQGRGLDLPEAVFRVVRVR